MNPDLLPGTVGTIGPAAVGVSFLAGLLFSLNPVAVAVIPLAMAYVTKAGREGTRSFTAQCLSPA